MIEVNMNLKNRHVVIVVRVLVLINLVEMETQLEDKVQVKWEMAEVQVSTKVE